MDERLLSQVIARVMKFNEEIEKWEPVGTSSGRFSIVHLVHYPSNKALRIYGHKIDGKREEVLDNLIPRDAYHRKSNTFIEWEDSQAIWGLNFWIGAPNFENFFYSLATFSIIGPDQQPKQPQQRQLSRRLQVRLAQIESELAFKKSLDAKLLRSGERLLDQAFAQVMMYDATANQWNQVGTSSGCNSRVLIVHCISNNTFRIHAERDNDEKEIVLDNLIPRKAYHKRLSKTFIQWFDSQAFWALNFYECNAAVERFCNLLVSIIRTSHRSPTHQTPQPSQEQPRRVRGLRLLAIHRRLEKDERHEERQLAWARSMYLDEEEDRFETSIAFAIQERARLNTPGEERKRESSN